MLLNAPATIRMAPIYKDWWTISKGFTAISTKDTLIVNKTVDKQYEVKALNAWTGDLR